MNSNFHISYLLKNDHDIISQSELATIAVCGTLLENSERYFSLEAPLMYLNY